MAPAAPQPGKRHAKQPNSAQPAQRRAASASNAPEVVDPVWLLKAGGLVVLAALICGYLTFCLLFYQGQWQLVLHPDRSKPAPATIAGSSLEIVHFGVDETGSPQLTGWWLPGSPSVARKSRLADETLLYIPSGDGSLADAQSTLAALHSLGLNIFAFNYRGYGQSAATHPNERRMTQDTASAWQYLVVSRGIAGRNIVPYGVGVGAALAAGLAASQTQIPGVILQSPLPNLTEIVRADPRVRLLPVRALFHDAFDITATVSSLKTPKLFLLEAGSAALGSAEAAGDPKMISTLPPSEIDGPKSLEQIGRFLDQAGTDNSRPK